MTRMEPITDRNSPLLHRWDLPGTHRQVTHRNGSAGAILAVALVRIDRTVEKLDIPGVNEPWDEAGYNYRPLRGGTALSRHAYGLADDFNWNRHPQGASIHRTFTNHQIAQIRKIVKSLEVVEWGGEWPSHPGSKAKTDGMHIQIADDATLEDCERVARARLHLPAWREVLHANPGQRKVIKS